MKRRETAVSWRTHCFVQLLTLARREELIPGICHTHPSGLDDFSAQDNRNEQELTELAQRRNGEQIWMVSLLLSSGGAVRARIWQSPGQPANNLAVREIGEHINRWSCTDAGKSAQPPTFLQRQAMAIGAEATHELRGLSVAVVGCGGTGSAAATMLARLGVGRMLLVDDDIIDETNLNRLHGGNLLDVSQEKKKVDVLSGFIRKMGLGTEVVSIDRNVAHASCRDALRSCDVIFGCTDDHWGRSFLNRLAYFYLIPLIDTGLGVDVGKDGKLTQLTGRVTVVRPGNHCLHCRKRINPHRVREEVLQRTNPQEYQRLKKEGYVTRTREATPAIVSFTTDTAASAINELLAAITGFRRSRGWAAERLTRYDLDKIRRTGARSNSECRLCQHQKYWGLADVDPFLDQVG